MTKINKIPAKISVKPLMGYVLIEPGVAETKTLSGIILPDSAQEEQAQGIILSVGEDIMIDLGKVIKSPVKVGDKVIYKRYGVEEIKVEGKQLKLVKFSDLIAIIEN